MVARVSAILPIDTRGLWIGTFHGLCNRMLRAHHRDAALPQAFQILDTADQLAAIKRLLKANGVDDDKYPPRDVQRFINGAKEDGQRPGDVEAYDSFRQRLIEIYRLYEAQCQREGVVDFPELLLRAYELLSRNVPIREHYQRRFKHILVDEFQDTNTLQYKWLTLLAGAGAHLFAVGDDDLPGLDLAHELGADDVEAGGLAADHRVALVVAEGARAHHRRVHGEAAP
jgi:DNA helicase-2/ATP-dependent DNA helicase PcrA